MEQKVGRTMISTRSCMFQVVISERAPSHSSPLPLDSYFLKAEKFHPSSGNPRASPANHGMFGARRTVFPSETAVSSVARLSICLALKSTQPINGYVMESCREMGLRDIE